MKLSRPLASAIGLAIVAASALAIAAPASAATPGVTYVTAAQVPVAAADAVGWSQLSGDPVSSSLEGLSAGNSMWVSYGLPAPIAATSGTALSALAAASSFVSSDDSLGYAQIFWQDGNGIVQRFYAIESGPSPFTNDTALWFSTVFINGNTVQTLAGFDVGLQFDPAFVGATLLAVGVSFDSVDPVDLQAFTVDGADFSFLPAPAAVAPTTLTQVAYAASGITITTTGFLPNEELEVYQTFPTAAGPDGGNAPAVTADANGAIRYTFLPVAGVTPLIGNYNLTFVGAAGAQTFDYTVVASLAATGTDSFAPLVASGVLLLGGAALAIVAMNRRRTV